MSAGGGPESLPWWSWAAPAAAALLLLAAGRVVATGSAMFLVPAPLVLVAAVFAAVHHAETVSRRLGEVLGVILLGLAVTAIEVSLIAALMLHAPDQATTVARDTVFAGVMVVLNGVIGLALLAGGMRFQEQRFQLQATASALGVLGTLAVITMILPDYTVTEPAAVFAPVQLVFVSVSSLILYSVYIYVQATSQRAFFTAIGADEAAPIEPVSTGVALRAAVLLAATLVAIVLLADALSPEVQRVVRGVGLPIEFVAVVVAMLVLLPEGTASVRAARAGRLQTSLNLALGSAIASTGLTIPAIALFSAVQDAPIELGLAPEHMVLLILSLFVSSLNFSTGRATVLQGVIHLVIFVVFLVIAAVP